MRALACLIAVAALAGCTPPPPSAYVTTSSRQTGADLGRTAAGDECRYAGSGAGADVWCGTWQAPSARIRAAPGTTAAAVAAGASEALAARLTCAAARPTTILGGEPALLAECRMTNGGWPAFLLAAAPGGRGWETDGVLPALPAAERGLGIAAGLVTAAAAPRSSQALDMMAQRLAREAFATGDIGKYDELMTIGRDANQAERFAAAEVAYRAALDLQERTLGHDQPGSYLPLSLLALQLSNQGRTPEAGQLFARAERLAPRAADPLAVPTVVFYEALAQANQHHTAQALAGFARAEALYLPHLPPELRSGTPLPADQGASLTPWLSSRDVLPDPVSQRAVVGVIEARRNAADVLRRAGRVGEAELKIASANRLAAAAPGVTGANLILARVDRTAGTVAASAGAPGAAETRLAAAASRFARGVPRSRPYADTLLLRAASLPAGTPEIATLCRDAIATLRALREGTSAGLIAPCVDAFATAPTDEARLAEAFEAAQLAQGNVTTTQIARAAARLAESARDPKVGAAIRQRDEALHTLAARYRERDEATIEGQTAEQRAELDAHVAAAEAAAADADRAVQAASPGFAQLVQSVVPAGDVLKVLAPDEALLLTTLPPHHHGWNFLLRGGHISAARVGADTAEIERLVRDVRASVEDGAGEKPFAAESAWRLHQALFAGLETAIAGVKSLLVVPTDALLEIPYGILVTQAPPAPKGQAGNHYLIERMALTHLPAAASLVSLRHAGASTAPEAWAGFGAPRPVPAAYAARSFPAAPDCGRTLAGLPPLPGAAVELGLAAKIMAPGAARPIIGPAFTSDALVHADLRQYRVLHFATHGILPGDLACLAEPVIIASAAAAGPDAAEAMIGASTVMNLNLDANLVIVSACNSGGGAGAGESLSTLARAFFFAGARGLLLTHWYINDIAAARVVATMLNNMQGGQAAAEALRKAQLDLLRIPEGAHPALWGPFALVGTAGSPRAGNGT
jgi:CHAT domain-containing protein/tetratricopeptide (TPR) repeat protein